MKASQKKTALVIVAAVSAGAGILAVLPTSPVSRSWHQWKSLGNVKRIGNALCVYSQTHQGVLPSRLSSLYPEYISRHGAFFVRNPVHANPSAPGTDLEAPQLIDRHSPYTIMASLTGSRAMVFERTGLWKDASIAWQKLARTGDGEAFAEHESARSSAAEFAAILIGYLVVSP